MVLVPAGSFWMGCAPFDTSCAADESPYHEVDLATFLLDVTEVTVDAYAGCGGCSDPYTYNAAEPEYNWLAPGDRTLHPVNGVTWDQAGEFCDLAGKRLPTEAEWEKAARGTNERIFPWGNALADCTRARAAGCGGSGTIEVGSLPMGASAYGALDMAGNVREWVEDNYSPDYSSGPANPTDRVWRGGCYATSAAGLRASDRDSAPHTGQPPDVGFRCAWTP